MNISKAIRISLAALTVLCSSSCLEKYPGSYIPVKDAMKTYNDAEQHLDGIYASLKGSSLYSGLLTLLPDIQADLVYAVEGNSNTYGNIWQWKVLTTGSEYEAVYGSLYSVIGNCNFFLDNIDYVKGNVTDDRELDNLEDSEGAVYAIRALCYSELIKMFCKAYEPSTAKDEQGVVLRTRYYETEPVVRASLYDSYQFVLSDLEKAEKLLNGDYDEANSNYMTLAGAYAIHARVALYMQDWDAAIRYSSYLIDDRKDIFSLSSAIGATQSSGYTDFAVLWGYDQGNEVIWRIGFTTTSYGGALGTVFLNYTRDYRYFYPDYVPANWVLGLYGSNDSRYGSYFADSSVTGIQIGYANGLDCPLLLKYYGNRNFIPSRIYHVHMPKPLRLAEQYLIRAEAYCRSTTQKNFSKASADFNALRAKRLSSPNPVTLNESNWMDNIGEERVRELYMEGFRLQDLKRWHKGFTRTPQASSQKEGSSLKISADDPRFVWPIPQHELEAPGADIKPNDSNN